MTTKSGYSVKELISAEEVREVVESLAKRIVSDFAGREVMLVGVLDGAFVFLSELSRALLLGGMNNLTIDFIGIDTYGAGTDSSGEPKITKDLKHTVKDKTVLIVDDILDTGFSLSILQSMIGARQPKELHTIVLLSKRARRKVEVSVEYIGREIPDKFVVGYGLDYAGHHRELPYIGVVEFNK